MSGSFKSHGFLEGAEGAHTFPIWARKAKSAILEVPGANQDTIQTFGRKSDTLAELVTVTKAQLDALNGDVGTVGSLVFHYGTFTAYLDSIDGHEILAADKYAVVLNFIRQ
jgi:hypothetical protein